MQPRISHRAVIPNTAPADRTKGQRPNEAGSAKTQTPQPLTPSEAVAKPKEASDGSKTGRVQFEFKQPTAKEVFVAGSFNNWQSRTTPLKRRSDRTWVTELALNPGEYEYKFIVDGEWVEDPAAKRRVPNSFGSHNSVLQVKL